MTKDQEIQWLAKAVTQLGPDSYLGPWLKEITADLVADIRNDVCPTAPLPSAARREAHEILTRAKADAAQLRAAATASAEKERDLARDQAVSIRQRVRINLEQLAMEVRV